MVFISFSIILIVQGLDFGMEPDKLNNPIDARALSVN